MVRRRPEAADGLNGLSRASWVVSDFRGDRTLGVGAWVRGSVTPAGGTQAATTFACFQPAKVGALTTISCRGVGRIMSR
jgi:hypothetical protein